jgi:hypothetical protein
MTSPESDATTRRVFCATKDLEALKETSEIPTYSYEAASAPGSLSARSICTLAQLDLNFPEGCTIASLDRIPGVLDDFCIAIYEEALSDPSYLELLKYFDFSRFVMEFAGDLYNRENINEREYFQFLSMVGMQINAAGHMDCNPQITHVISDFATSPEHVSLIMSSPQDLLLHTSSIFSGSRDDRSYQAYFNEICAGVGIKPGDLCPPTYGIDPEQIKEYPSVEYKYLPACREIMREKENLTPEDKASFAMEVGEHDFPELDERDFAEVYAALDFDIELLDLDRLTSTSEIIDTLISDLTSRDSIRDEILVNIWSNICAIEGEITSVPLTIFPSYTDYKNPKKDEWTAATIEYLRTIRNIARLDCMGLQFLGFEIVRENNSTRLLFNPAQAFLISRMPDPQSAEEFLLSGGRIDHSPFEWLNISCDYSNLSQYYSRISSYLAKKAEAMNASLEIAFESLNESTIEIVRLVNPRDTTEALDCIENISIDFPEDLPSQEHSELLQYIAFAKLSLVEIRRLYTEDIIKFDSVEFAMRDLGFAIDNDGALLFHPGVKDLILANNNLSRYADAQMPPSPQIVASWFSQEGKVPYALPAHSDMNHLESYEIYFDYFQRLMESLGVEKDRIYLDVFDNFRAGHKKVMLLLRDEYEIYTQSLLPFDLDNYLSLISQIPAYISRTYGLPQGSSIDTLRQKLRVQALYLLGFREVDGVITFIPENLGLELLFLGESGFTSEDLRQHRRLSQGEDKGLLEIYLEFIVDKFIDELRGESYPTF